MREIPWECPSLIHFARHGRDQRGGFDLQPQACVWIHCGGVLLGGHRCLQLFRLGPPHVYYGHFELRDPGVLANDHAGRGAFGDKIFNWAFTFYKGSVTFETPMLYSIGFMGLFTIGGMTGVFLAATGTDIHLTETYFIVAHFHFVMVGGMLMAFLSGIHFWWSKWTGRMYPEKISELAAVVTFIGFCLTFFPQFILGTLGMPRRYASYPPEFQALNVFSTAGATILGVGYLLPILYLTWSLKCGAVAGDNPWQATGLEWMTQSPRLTDNFAEIPIMDHEAYDYEWLEREQQFANNATA